MSNYISIGKRGTSDVIIDCVNLDMRAFMRTDEAVYGRTDIDRKFFSMVRDYGFYPISQSNIYGGQPKARESVAYIELDGEEIGEYMNNTYEPFDYEVEFMAFTDNMGKDNLIYAEKIINTRIGTLNEFLANNGQIILYNTFNGQRIVGYYKGYEITTDERQKWQNIKDFKSFKLQFRINKPNLCKFAMLDEGLTNELRALGVVADINNITL